MAKLTEQDILNWDGPEEDYMNSDQLAFFRELLVKMQEELIEMQTPLQAIFKSTNPPPILPTELLKKKSTL